MEIGPSERALRDIHVRLLEEHGQGQTSSRCRLRCEWLAPRSTFTIFGIEQTKQRPSHDRPKR